MTNVQMGSCYLGISGFVLSNSPSNSSSSVQNFPVCQKPIFQNALKSIGAKKRWDFQGRFPCSSTSFSFWVYNTSISQIPISLIDLNSVGVNNCWNFDGRKPKITTTRALAHGEVDVHSASTSLLEKEFKFSPTFDDYVKVMESVKTDRSKNLSGNRDDISPKKRSVRKDLSRKGLVHRERDKTWKKKKHGGVESREGGWNLVERILEKKASRRSDNDLKDGIKSNEQDRYVDKKRVDQFANHSKRWKDRQQNGKEVKRVDEFAIRNRTEDPQGSGSHDSFSGIRRVGRKESINYTNNGRGEMDVNESNQSKKRNYDRTKVQRKVVDDENNNDLLERKSSIIKKPKEPVVAKNSYGSGRFYDTNTSNKSGVSKIQKHMLKDEIGSSMAERRTEANLRRRETNIHGMVTTTNTHAYKGDLFISEKEDYGHDRSQRHATFHGEATERGNLGSRTIKMRGTSGKTSMQSDKVANIDADGIDIEDRAAFRTFEVFTDVRNRPRVLRMELEERIEKLANQLNATDVNMPEWQFSKMIHSAQIKFTEHSILRVVQKLGALGNWKRALQVVEWLQSRERFKTYKSRYIYTTVLDVLGKAKRPIEALNIFYAMRQELSSYPDLAAYHCIAVTLGQAGLMKELFDVIDCMRAVPEKKFKLGPLQKWDPRLEPDLIVYNAVLNACVQQKQWEGAFWVLQQLKQQNIQPTNTTCGLIMEVMLACGKYSLVHEFFRKVEKTSIPSTLHYKVLVDTLWREGKTDEAVLVVKDMERRGVVGSASLYYELARCLCSAGRCEEALLQISKICKVAKKPLVVTYTGLIQACLDSGSIENGTYIFNQMHKFCSPNIVTCNIMLKSYIEHGMLEEAKDLFQKMLDGSHPIKSKSDAAQKPIPDKFTFNTMMDACAATNNWDDFENTFQQMLHHGYHFDTRRHLRMVLDALRAGKKQIIETTWEHLIRFGRAPPPPIIQERFCIKLQEDKPLAALSCIDAYQGEEMHAFSEKSWLNLLYRNGRRFKKDTICRLASKLSSSVAESDRSHPMYQNLLNACGKFCSNL